MLKLELSILDRDGCELSHCSKQNEKTLTLPLGFDLINLRGFFVSLFLEIEVPIALCDAPSLDLSFYGGPYKIRKKIVDSQTFSINFDEILAWEGQEGIA